MTTDRLPPLFATNVNYSSGPDSGTPTKVDPATPTNGFVRGTAIVAQHANFFFSALNAAVRRAMTLAALRLQVLDTGAGGPPSDHTAGIGCCSTPLGTTIAAKGDVDGVYAFFDADLADITGSSMAAITTLLRKVVFNGSRHLAVGTGGNQNAFSTNNGLSWTAGGAMGLATGPTDCVWDGTDFVASNDAGGAVHSTNGVAWTAATFGSDISDVLTGGHGNGLAVLSGGTVFAAGKATNVAFAKSTDHGLTWSNTGGTIPSAASYVGRGWLVGNGGTELYWLGNKFSVGPGDQLTLFVSTDGITWTQRSVIPGLVGTEVGLATTPRLLLCPDTGLMIAVALFTAGGFATWASFNLGLTWTERVMAPTAINSVGAFDIANGRLFATRTDRILASDGIGAE